MDIQKRLEDGKIKPYELEEVLLKEIFNSDENKWEDACKKAAEMRLKFLEKRTGKMFEYINKSYVPTSNKQKHTTGVENKIGGASVPLGFAGPLKIKGEYANGEFYIPLATNEAALIAGLSRGIKAINMADGITTIIRSDIMTRAPTIEAPDIATANIIVNEIKNRGTLFSKIKEASESKSRVTKLIDIQPFQFGRYIHMRFVFQTGDAMGMNSATKYTALGIDALLQQHPNLKLKSLTGNLCTDKKASHINVLLGRGKSVETEVNIPLSVIKDVFKTSGEEIVELNNIKNYYGSSLSGTVTGFNANVANTIAAIFIATGQDAAQIVESSSAFTRAEIKNDMLIFGCTFPCLEVATVGGGTEFGTARECLDMLGCAGPGKNPGDNAKKLAEIIAASATAQDLNLLATESHGYELAESHIKMARGKAFKESSDKNRKW